MVKDDTTILEVVLEKNGFAEITAALFQDLNNVVQEKTLGHKVATALIQRKQGHFDKAVLTISEANRDQVLAIRKTQSIIDKIEIRIFEIKTSIIDCICKVVQGQHSHISIEDKTSLVKNIYQILSSSIQTLDSKFVEIEPAT